MAKHFLYEMTRPEVDAALASGVDTAKISEKECSMSRC